MNNLKKIFMMMALSLASISFSQEPIKADSFGAATISTNYVLVLDVTADLMEFYSADATALNWPSADEALKLCGYYSNNLVSFYPDYANKKLLVHIHLDLTKEPKDIIWWNQYLHSIRN